LNCQFLFSPDKQKIPFRLPLAMDGKLPEKVGEKTGTNMYPSVGTENGTRQYFVTSVKVEKVPEKVFHLAISQTHYSMEGRAIVRETTLEEYLKNPVSGNEKEAEDMANSVTLYDAPVYNGHHWEWQLT